MQKIEKYDQFTSKSICAAILEQMKSLTIETFNPTKEYLSRYFFVTKNSSDIKIPLLKKAAVLLQRDDARKTLEKYVDDYIAADIEKGIFEFSLIQVVINKLQDHFVQNIYMDKLNDICVNLDTTDKNVDNQTLLPTIIGTQFRPFFTAFLSPEQIHPKRWAEIAKHYRTKQESVNNVAVTDAYKCSKCGERKMSLSRLQLRCADEPESIFLVCLVCHRTFII